VTAGRSGRSWRFWWRRWRWRRRCPWPSGWQVYRTDLNADGRGDFVLYNPTTGEWREARNITLGTFSETQGFWEPNLTVVTTHTPPSTPGALVASQITSQSATIAWAPSTAVSGTIAGYRVGARARAVLVLLLGVGVSIAIGLAAAASSFMHQRLSQIDPDLSTREQNWTRGLAVAVYTHAFYDLYVMLLR